MLAARADALFSFLLIMQSPGVSFQADLVAHVNVVLTAGCWSDSCQLEGQIGALSENLNNKPKLPVNKVAVALWVKARLESITI